MILTLILILIFTINYLLYWIIFLKTKESKSKFWKSYTKIYLIIWSVIAISIPIINSSFFGQKGYFFDYWIWFLLIGIIIICVGMRLIKSAMDINKNRGLEKGKYQLMTDGVYKIMRHPIYCAWGIIFLGLTFVLDSFISLVISPFFIFLLKLECIIEEKYLLLPRFGKKYEKYMEKTPNSLFPPPYNALLTIIAIFIVYVGFLNIEYIIL
ncbi:MAG: methyltransferase family protein [Promethearchaeota archaeon]